MQSEICIKMYPTCKLVQGSKFSAVYDLDRRQLYRFDSAYYPLFSELEKGSWREGTEQGLEPDAAKQVVVVLEMAQTNEIVYRTSDPAGDMFEALSEEWHSPHEMQNCIVDVADMDHDWIALRASLDELRCPGLQIRCFSDLVDLQKMLEILEVFGGSCVANLQFVIRWNEELDAIDWGEVCSRYKNLLFVKLHGAQTERRISWQQFPAMMDRLVIHEPKKIASERDCGAIAVGSLSAPSAKLFAELHSFNGCLHRKISVRQDGSICNCPSLRASYGTDLAKLPQISAKKEFRAYWTLKKDDMAVCSRCEFRYVCTDCRGYLGSDLSLEKPARCKYDPDTGLWDG